MVEVVSVVAAVLRVNTRLSVDDVWTRITSGLVNIRVTVRSDRSVITVLVTAISVDGVKVNTRDDTFVAVKVLDTVPLLDSKTVEVAIEVAVERPTVVNVLVVALIRCLMKLITGVVASSPMNRVILDVCRETEVIYTSCMSMTVVKTMYGIYKL